ERKPTSTIIRLGVTQKAASLVANHLGTQSRQSPESLINALKPHVIEHQWEPFLETAFDAGASIRQSLKALKRFGMPPEQYWPNLSGISYDNTVLDQEPPPFCYAFMQDYQNVKYLRLDFLNVEQPEPDPVQQVNQSPLGPVPYQATQRPLKLDAKERGKLVLLQIKAALAAGFPAVFGFSYDPALENEKTGEIRFPSPEEAGQYLDPQKSLNHAVLAVGYDDERRAFLFQNSWGESWGTEGYGWLPYEYVLKGLATDWWTLLNEAWVETGNFGLDNRFGGRRQTPF
ncbi:MAG TPA: C1 family peptidase, partial [Trichocoleus sp.]